MSNLEREAMLADIKQLRDGKKQQREVISSFRMELENANGVIRKQREEINDIKNGSDSTHRKHEIELAKRDGVIEYLKNELTQYR